jgi:hypothetical protein
MKMPFKARLRQTNGTQVKSVAVSSAILATDRDAPADDQKQQNI